MHETNGEKDWRASAEMCAARAMETAVLGCEEVGLDPVEMARTLQIMLAQKKQGKDGLETLARALEKDGLILLHARKATNASDE